jgi:protein-L-isoaspartate(D-aspartate) O-methyltransferase
MAAPGMLGRAPQVADGLLGVPRAAFLPPAARAHAGVDAPLPIGAGQTTSQPSLVVRMVQALGLTGTERVLEIGGGTGFAAAALARNAGEVYTVERVPELAAQARAILTRLGLDNVQVITADGTRGLPQFAPYEAILVSAGAPQVPPPLLVQLAVGGRLVIPVGQAGEQRLMRITRVAADRFQPEDLGAVAFVPLVQR